MTGCPEYKYWLKDNEKNLVTDKALPSWIASIRALDALVKQLKKETGEDDT